MRVMLLVYHAEQTSTTCSSDPEVRPADIDGDRDSIRLVVGSSSPVPNSGDGTVANLWRRGW